MSTKVGYWKGRGTAWVGCNVRMEAATTASGTTTSSTDSEFSFSKQRMCMQASGETIKWKARAPTSTLMAGGTGGLGKEAWRMELGSSPMLARIRRSSTRTDNKRMCLIVEID